MAVKTVLRMGHSVIRLVAEPAREFNTPALNDLIQDRFDSITVAQMILNNPEVRPLNDDMEEG